MIEAMDGEPTFELMARDPYAPALVRLWVAQRRLDVRNGVRPVSDLDQIERAAHTAEKMETWRRDADEVWRKQPQLPFPPVSDGRACDTFGQDAARDRDSAFCDATVYDLDAPTLGVRLSPTRRDPLAGQHLARREQDEYVCTRCTKRWGADEPAPECNRLIREAMDRVGEL